MNKVDEILDILKADKKEKSDSPLLWILAIVGGVIVVAGIAYAVYRYFTPSCCDDDFDEDFDDEFDDDYFEDDDEVIEVKYTGQSVDETEEVEEGMEE